MKRNKKLPVREPLWIGQLLDIADKAAKYPEKSRDK
jgi:hypothetical protein